MITCSLPAADLSRILGNALAMLPARSGVSTVALRLSGNTVTAIGTDGYIAGEDRAQVHGLRGEAEFLIDREDAAGMERFARIDPGRVMPSGKLGGPRKAGERLTLAVSVDSAEVSDGNAQWRCPIAENPHDASIYRALADILDPGAEARPLLMLNQGVFSRFDRVKPDKAGRMADLSSIPSERGPDGPPGLILVKIGATFRGLIRPIDRVINAKNVGQEGLW